MQITTVNKSFRPQPRAVEPQRLTELETEPMEPVLAGDTVVFASGKSQPLSREIYTVGSDGSSFKQLTDRQVNLSWQPAA